MRESTGKPLPTQLLNTFLNRATEAALIQGETASRRLATTLEKHVIRLRWAAGGKSLLKPSSGSPTKDQQSRTIQKKRPIYTPPPEPKRQYGDCPQCKKMFLEKEQCFYCRVPLVNLRMQ